MATISVSLVYALTDKQYFYETSLPRGSSAEELINLSSFMSEIPELSDADPSDLTLGVFAQKIESDYLLEEGDRVEIYRSLTADPKEVRRQLALLGKTIGKK